MCTPPKKKRKYVCKYQPSWENKYKWISRSHKGNDSAYCRVCQKHFKIDHGGKNDVKKHSLGVSHTAATKTQNSTVPVLNFFVTSQDQDVIRAETIFCNFLTEHNLPFSVANHFTKVCKKMFPDSQIARKFACSRTKTTMVVKKALAPTLEKEVVEHCKSQPFSLACDESNDRNTDKTLAILVRYFTNKAVTRFLAMPICNIGASQNIFDHIQQVFLDHDIPWGNVISFVSDNCSVMKGRNNSVMTRIKEKQPDVFDMGCVCHLANLCAVAAIKTLPLPIEDLLVDVYFHFFHSSSRKEKYKEFLDFCDVEPTKLLKHCSTRWLSLEKCVKRLLDHWPALRSYFLSHEDVERPGRIKRTADHLSSPEMHLYYHFLAFILEPLNEFNTIFQADESRIGFMAEEMQRLLRKFLGKFIKAKVIRDAVNFTEVDIKDPDNHLSDSMVAVGPFCRAYLVDHEDTITPLVSSRFFQSVRNFYGAVVTKMVAKFPFNDPVVTSLGFLNPSRRGEDTLASVMAIARRFPRVVPKEDHAKLEEEVTDFCVTPDKELPRYIPGETRVDEFWGQLGKLTTKICNEVRFPVLHRLAGAMLTIPNSNAECERTFSLVRKIQTENRMSMDNETLCCLLCCRMNMEDTCCTYQPTQETLKMAKSATRCYNIDHSSSSAG